MTLIISGLYSAPIDEPARGGSSLCAYCCADSLGSTVTDEGGLKIASTNRRKIHVIKPEVQVPNYRHGWLEGYVTRPIIPLGVAHAGNVYLTSTILIEFEASLHNLRAVRGARDRERKLVPPWHPDAEQQSRKGDDDHLSTLSPRSNMRFFARLLQIHATAVIEDAREVFGPSLHAGMEDFAFVLLGYCEMEQKVMAFHFQLTRPAGVVGLPVVGCRKIDPGEDIVLGLTTNDQITILSELKALRSDTNLAPPDAARKLGQAAISARRFQGVGGHLTRGIVTSGTGFHLES